MGMFNTTLLADRDKKFPVEGGLDEDLTEANYDDLVYVGMIPVASNYMFASVDGQYLWILTDDPNQRWVIYERAEQ